MQPALYSVATSPRFSVHPNRNRPATPSAAIDGVGSEAHYVAARHKARERHHEAARPRRPGWRMSGDDADQERLGGVAGQDLISVS
jgi:hypothetical protein